MTVLPSSKKRATPLASASELVTLDAILLTRLAKAIEAIAKLPAIPVLDWCERAARALMHLLPQGRVALVMGQLSEAGVLETMVSCGISAGTCGNHADPDCRARVERLIGLPWAPGITGKESEPEVFLPSQSGYQAEVWASTPHQPVLARRITLGADTLVIVAYFQSESDLPAVKVVDAALASIAKRARGIHWPERAGGWISPSEQVILDYLVLGRSVREVAELEQKSPHTIHDHVKSLHRKLNATSRAMLVSMALGHAQPKVDVVTDGQKRTN